MVRLVTWNVNSLKMRMPRVLELLDMVPPDILLLQETKCPANAFPHLDLETRGYVAADHSAGRWNGVAIVARRELGVTDVVRGLPGESDVTEARWVEATVGGARCASVYVPNGRMVGTPTFTAKLAFLDAMIARAAALRAAGPLIVAGDLNVTPADVDVYDPDAFVGSTHVTAEERGRLHDLGLVDLFRACHAEEPGFTWWDYRAGHFHKGMGLRIDLVLVSQELAAGECRVLRDFRKGTKPSDHAPLLAELHLPA